MGFELVLSSLLALHSQVQQVWCSTLNKSLNIMKAIKLTKHDTFFTILRMDLKLITKLPKCMLGFFYLINRAKGPFQVIDNYFPLIFPYFGYNLYKSPIDQSYTFSKFFFHIITQIAPINSFTYLIHPNNIFRSHMKFFIEHPFRQNLHNIYLQAANTSKIHILSNSIQIIIIDSKTNHTHALVKP